MLKPLKWRSIRGGFFSDLPLKGWIFFTIYYRRLQRGRIMAKSCCLLLLKKTRDVFIFNRWKRLIRWFSMLEFIHYSFRMETSKYVQTRLKITISIPSRVRQQCSTSISRRRRADTRWNFRHTVGTPITFVIVNKVRQFSRVGVVAEMGKFENSKRICCINIESMRNMLFPFSLSNDGAGNVWS